MNDLLRLLTEHTDDADAIASPDRVPLMYARLSTQILRMGGELRSISIAPDSRVAMVLPNGPLMASAFASLAPWCTTAPLNPAYKSDEFEFYLQDLEASALMVETGSESGAIEVAHGLGIRVIEIEEGEEAGSFSVGEVKDEVPARAEDAIALVLHTSGTTSRPKMVPLSMGNLAASASNIAATLQLSDADRCLNVMPLFHIHGLMAPVLASLISGASVYCTPGFDALRFFAWLDDARPSWYSAVPTMHQGILSRAPRNREVIERSSLRFVRSSSASLPPQVMEALEATFSAPVVEAYAMTEAAHQMCSNPLPPETRKPGCVGPAAGPEVAIMNENGVALATDDVGEIVIRGKNVTSGYIKNPEANANAFHEGGWFRTGDQGLMDADGYVKITGRLKEIINRGGEKIAPLEVDEVILDHGAVAQVCTFAIPHEKLGEEVGAAVVLQASGEVTEKELREFVALRLADFKVPKRILFVDEIPKGPTGKIQRIGLAKAFGLAT